MMLELFGYDPYNAREFRRTMGDRSAPTELRCYSGRSPVPLGELKSLAEDRRLIFDQELFCGKWVTLIPLRTPLHLKDL